MSTHRPRRLPLDLGALTATEALFRLTGARDNDPAVERWFGGDPSDLHAIARQWFQQMRQCGRDVRELIHDGCPVACVGDAAFGYVNSFRTHVNVGFFRGALLKDRAGLLAGNGKRMRHVKISRGGQTDEEALNELIQAAYADIRQQLAGDPDQPPAAD